MHDTMVTFDEPLKSESSSSTLVTWDDSQNTAPLNEPGLSTPRLSRRRFEDSSPRLGKSRLSSLTSHLDKIRKSPRTPRLERFSTKKRDQFEFAKMASIDSLDLASPAAPLRADAGIYSRHSLEEGEHPDDYFETMRKRAVERRSKSDTAIPPQESKKQEPILRAPKRRTKSHASLPHEVSKKRSPQPNDDLLLEDYFVNSMERGAETDADTLGDTVGASTFADTLADTIKSEPARLEHEYSRKKKKKSKKSKRDSKHCFAQIHFESEHATVTYTRVSKRDTLFLEYYAGEKSLGKKDSRTPPAGEPLQAAASSFTNTAA